MRRAWLCVLALAGCDRVFGIGDPYEDARPALDSTTADAPVVDAPTDPTDGMTQPGAALIARYPFDGDLSSATGGQPAMGASGYTLHTTGGHFGGYVALDGTGCLTFTLPTVPAHFSIVLWANVAASSGSLVPILSLPHVAASTTPDWGFSATDTVFEFTTGSQGFGTSPGLSTSLRQFAATFDGSNVRLYVDSSPSGPLAPQSSFSYGTNMTVYLGCAGAGGTNARLSGGIDEVEIYDGVLTGSQVADLLVTPPP